MKVMFPIWRKDSSNCKKWTCPFHLTIQWGFEQLPEHCGISLLPVLPKPSLLLGTRWKKRVQTKKKKKCCKERKKKEYGLVSRKKLNSGATVKICNLEYNNFWLSGLHLLSDVIHHYYMYMYCVLRSLELT